MAAKSKSQKSIYALILYHMALIMIIYSLCRLAFYLCNFSLFKHIGFTELAYAFWGGLKFDLAALLYLNSLYIVLQTVPFPFKYREGYQIFCKYLFLIVNTIGITANFADFAYYKFTLKRTTASVFSQFANEQNGIKLAFNFLLDYWYLAIALILLLYGFAKLYQLFNLRTQPKFTWTIFLVQTASFILIGGLMIIGMRGGWRHSTRPITLSNAGDFVDNPADMSIVLNTPFSIIRTLKAATLKPIAFFPSGKLDSLYNPIHQPNAKSPFKKLNVVFLIIESLGKEHVGALNKNQLNGKYKGYTPFIDSLVEQSFTSTRTYANGRRSIDALPSVISSIPSIREPFVLSTYSGNRTESIAKLLGNKGYETAFFHGAPNGSMGFSAYTHLAGIKKYFGKTEYNNDDDFDGIWGIWDEPFMQFMAHQMNTFKQPFFSAFFSVSSHHPFKVPEKYKNRFPKGPLPVQEPIGYTDMAIRKFFATASKMPWYKQTLFVLVADHATVSYLPSYQTIPGYFAVPILFYYPGGNLKGTTNKLIQQIDIMPTVLNYLNFDQLYFAFGFDAFDAKNNNFVVNNNDGTFNIYQDDYLLLHDELKPIGLFNLKLDPLMQHNLVTTQTVIKAKLTQSFKAFLQQYNNRMIKDQLTTK